MLISIMQFPPIKEGHDDEFRQWFKWSGEQFNNQEGLISRRLFKPQNEGNYVVIVEIENQITFDEMHSSPTQAVVHDRLVPLLNGKPTHEFLDLVEGL